MDVSIASVCSGTPAIFPVVIGKCLPLKTEYEVVLLLISGVRTHVSQ